MTDAPTELSWVRTQGAALVRLPEVMDERFSSGQVSAATEPLLIVDFSRVRMITSPAVREWVKAIRTVRATYCGLINCRPAVVTQFNTVVGFGGKADLISFFAPYACQDCGPQEHLIDLRVNGALQRVANGEPQPCSKCQKPAELDDFASLYFAYACAQPEPRVPPLAERVIAGKLDAQRKFQPRKEIVGELPIFHLTGTLDHRVRLDRLFAGTQGTVLAVLAELDDVDSEVRLGDVVSTVALLAADLPLQLYERLTQPQQTALTGRAVSMLVPGRCTRCKADQRARIAAPSLGLVLDAVCPSCGGTVQALTPPTNVPASLFTTDVPQNVVDWLSLQSEANGLPTLRETAISGRYEIVREIGRGGMGEVHLARQHGPAGFEKEVVIKRIIAHRSQQEALLTANLLREARLAARISHPNVVQIFDLDHDGEAYFVAMEYVAGANLRAVLQRSVTRQRPMPLELACRVVSDICSALNAAHNATADDGAPRGFIHRDMSPENVLISREGVVKVTDFGLAILTRDAAREGDISSATGKPRYFAPEHVTGSGVLDLRVDIFATGIMLYECLTLRHPFERDNDWQTMQAMISDPLPTVERLRPDCPPTLAAIVTRALARAREERYASAAEMRRDLEDVIMGLGRPATSLALAEWLTPII
jgi:serine/threonine-protein kinase